MIRSPGVSYVVGAVTLWPPLYIVGFMVWALTQVLSGGPGGSPPSFAVLAGLHIGTILLSLALLAVYVVDAVRNPRLEGSDMRVVWVVLLVVVAMGAMPVYWWLHLRPGGEAFASRRVEAPA